MHLPLFRERSHRARDLCFFVNSALWPQWPYLPVVKRLAGQQESYGVLFAALEAFNLPGYSATVFLTNFFLMPRRLEEFLQLPRETFDTCEELADAGWCVD